MLILQRADDARHFLLSLKGRQWKEGKRAQKIEEEGQRENQKLLRGRKVAEEMAANAAESSASPLISANDSDVAKIP